MTLSVPGPELYPIRSGTKNTDEILKKYLCFRTKKEKSRPLTTLETPLQIYLPQRLRPNRKISVDEMSACDLATE